MSWRDALLRSRATRLGEFLIKTMDFDIPWTLPNVRFPVYLQISKNPSELLFGGKEAEERDLFRKIAVYPYINELWDIGANVGQYSWEFISSGPSKRALVFEPDERNLRTIQKTIARSSLLNCEVRAVAVSNLSGQLIFKRDTITGKRGTIVEDARIEQIMGRSSSSITVNSTTIDNVCKETCRWPDILKIDVEGAEDRVIEGGLNTLKSYRPIILAEVQRMNFARIEQLLSPVGYSLFDAVTRKPAVPQSFNVVALDIGRHRQIYEILFS